MKVKVEIDTQTFIRFWLVVIGFALAAFAIYSARSALVILGTALFLAIALNAPVSYLAKYLPGRSRVGGTAIAFVVVVALIGSFITLVVPPVLQQTAKLAETIPSIVDATTNQYSGLNQFIDRYDLQPQVDSALDSLKDQSSQWTTHAGSFLVGSLSSVGAFFTAFILTLVLTFLMLVEGPVLLAKLWKMYADDAKMQYHKKVLHRMYTVVTSYVVGQLTVSAIGATISGLFIFLLSFIFNIPANLALPAAAIYFTLSLIPMFGASIGAVLIALLLVLNDPTAAIVYVIEFIIYQQIENNFVSPSIQSKRLDLSALLILASVTIGIYVFGLAGGIISIPVAGCLKVLFDEYMINKNRNSNKSKKPFAKLAKAKN